MQIPITNIYYLLAYAWDYLDEGEIVEVRPEDFIELADLFARVLVNGTNHVLRRGADRDYILHRETIPGIRGKFLPSETMKENALAAARAHCEFDELTSDILPNQIIRGTLRSLLRVQELDRRLREECRDLANRLNFAADIQITHRMFSQVRIHRNNAFYGFLLAICHFVFENLFIDEASGTSSFRSFDRDAHQMRRLFEAFVFRFLTRHFPGLSVSAPQIDWYGISRTDPSTATLPIMQTDIVVRSRRAALIIDTKFTPRAFQSRFDADRARSGHLYQVFTYVKNYALRHPSQFVSGMLLYPVVDEPFRCEYRLHDHPIQIRSIDLRLPWREIERDLRALIRTEDFDEPPVEPRRTPTMEAARLRGSP